MSEIEPRGPFELKEERSPELRAHGRLFFRIRGSEALFSCSGTSVRSMRRNVVFTAGHCVYDLGSETFHRDVIFVPAYREGEAPFGQYRAATLYAPSGWVDRGDTSYDIGAVILTERVMDRVGGRPLAFSQPLRSLSRLLILGYPAEPPERYDGERPIACDAVFARTFATGRPPSLVASPCDMERGSSGGGWIRPDGHLVSVVSHGYCAARAESCGYILGPYFGSAAVQLYRTAGGSEPVRLAFLRGPRPVTFNRRPAFRFAARGSTPVTFECRLDGGPFRRCRQAVRLPRLEPGWHVFRVRARDQVGRQAVIGHGFRFRRF